MLSALMAAALLSQQPANPVQQFQPVPVAGVPLAVFSGDVCDDNEEADCRREFLQKGAAWAGDVNGDGVREILVKSPFLGGTGGEPYFLFQQRQKSWEPLTPDGRMLTLTGSPRFDILPPVHGGYHDIRVDATGCFKWNGKEYVSYDTADFRKLSPAWFDASKLGEAELFWTMKYRGSQGATFEPQWFMSVPQSSINAEVDDPTLSLRWVAMFKGGVYGVQNGRSFLLVPQPAYGGAEQLELQGDWLVVSAGGEIARYNRRTKELLVR
jgi:hypothetical protein